MLTDVLGVTDRQRDPAKEKAKKLVAAFHLYILFLAAMKLALAAHLLLCRLLVAGFISFFVVALVVDFTTSTGELPFFSDAQTST